MINRVSISLRTENEKKINKRLNAFDKFADTSKSGARSVIITIAKTRV